MSKRKRNWAKGAARLKLLAGKLAKATEVPKDVAGPRDMWGRAALVPESEESLHWLGAVLTEIAEGVPIEDVLHEPLRPGRPATLRDQAIQYWHHRYRGKTHADAAKAAGSTASTMKRHAPKYRKPGLMLADTDAWRLAKERTTRTR
jgi:hypothetical protein